MNYKKEQINYLKSLLRSYKFLNNKLKLINEDLIKLRHKLVAINGPNYDGVRIENAYSEINPITIITENIERLERKYSFINIQIREIDHVLTNLNVDDREDIISVYINKSHTIEGRALLHGITEKQQRANIDRALYNAWLVKK